MGGITYQLVIAGFLPWTVRYRMIRYVSVRLPFGILLASYFRIFFSGGWQVPDRQVIAFICCTVVLHIWVTSKYTAYWKTRVLMYLRLVDYNCDLWRDVNLSEIGVFFSEKPTKFWQAVSFALIFGRFSSTVLALRYHSVSVRGGGTPLALKECGRLPGSSMTIRLKEVFL